MLPLLIVLKCLWNCRRDVLESRLWDAGALRYQFNCNWFWVVRRILWSEVPLRCLFAISALNCVNSSVALISHHGSLFWGILVYSAKWCIYIRYAATCYWCPSSTWLVNQTSSVARTICFITLLWTCIYDYVVKFVASDYLLLCFLRSCGVFSKS